MLSDNSKKQHSPKANNNLNLKLQKVLDEKKALFYHLSEQLFDINQDYLMINQHLKSLDKEAQELLKSYLDLTVQITQQESELFYQYEDIQYFTTKTNDLTSASNQDVDYYRTELTKNLKLYQDARKHLKKIQMECNQVTDNSHIDSLNFIEFCRYSHNVQVDQLQKFSIVKSLPSKDDIKKSKAFFKKQLLLSTKQFFKFYSTKIEEFQRKERILMGKAKNDIEQLYHNNPTSAATSATPGINQAILRSIEEQMAITSNNTHSNIFSGSVNDSNTGDINISTTIPGGAMTSNNHIVDSQSIDPFHILENKIANELMITLSNHQNNKIKTTSQVIKDTRQQLVELNKQVQLSNTLPTIQAAMNERSRNTIMKNRASILKAVTDFPTNSPLTKRATAILGRESSSTLLFKNNNSDSSILSREESKFNLSTASKVSALEILSNTNHTLNNSSDLGSVHSSYNKTTPITSPRQPTSTVSSTRKSSASMARIRQLATPTSAMKKDRGSNPTHYTTVVDTTPHSSTSKKKNDNNIQPTGGRDIDPETSVMDSIDLLNADIPVAMETNPFSISSRKEMKTAFATSNHRDHRTVFDINRFLDQCDLENVPQGTLINPGTIGHKNNPNSKTKSNLIPNNNNLNEESKTDAELLADIAKQLCTAEGQFRKLNSIKEGLDLHLIKQSQVLILLMKDLYGEMGCRLPDSLSAAPIIVDESALNKSFSPRFNMHNTSIGGAVSGRYRFQVDKDRDIHVERPYLNLDRASKYHEMKLNELWNELNSLLRIDEIQQNLKF